MTKILLTTAALLLGVVGASATQHPERGISDNTGATSTIGSGSSGKEDNQGYRAGPRWKYPMVRTNNRPFWHGMSSHRSRHHHWWEFWD